MVVASEHVELRATKSSIARSSCSSPICPWPTTTRASGTSRWTRFADRVDRLDAVVDEVDLPAARELRAGSRRAMTCWSNFTTLVWIASRSFGGVSMIDMSRMPTSDMCSVRGIGVARHREHVDLLPQLLDLLLVRDAEALLLVDDEQAEVAELDVLRQQAVRADDDVDLAGREIGERLLLLRLRAEAADHVDADGEAGEALAERLLVLEREHGRRREDRDLLAVHHRLERGAHRHFGLAVADVAAEQAVHRRRRLHVALDVGDRRSSGPA